MKTFGAREQLLATTIIAGLAAFATPALAQQAETASVNRAETVVVTGSRIVRQDFVAASPVASVTVEQVVAQADITLETFLNTLPQINPAGTTTSNNPGNSGQASVNLRGLGSNRNIVLIDGRRPMPSANTLSVDLNSIPAVAIQAIDVITGGAGATYGADAIAGAVNVRLKDRFEGAEFRANYSNSTEFNDAKEYSFSGIIGGNFADDRGNAFIAFDKSYREPMTKAQRPFSAVATSTTGTPPEGAVSWSAFNPVPESAVDALFATYGFSPADVTNQSGRFGFNRDGTAIFYGIAGPGFPVLNFRDPITINQNPRFFPDFYSYNFDAPNALVLPLDRTTVLSDIDFRTESGVEFFGQLSYTNYTADTLLAPTPLPTVTTRAPGFNTNLQASSALVTPGSAVPGCGAGSSLTNLVPGICSVANQLVVPVTNPFLAGTGIATLLAQRTGDDPALVGSGATEPFRYNFRPLGFGARRTLYDNTVIQYLAGLRGEIGQTGWTYEAYVSEGTTEVDLTQFGNIDTQRLLNVLANPVGTACATWNPFGNFELPAACRSFLESPVSRRQVFTQQVGQGFVRGDILQLPAGGLQTVLGVEYRTFEYTDRFLSQAGPFSGFNVGDPEGGSNEFLDFFFEALVPVFSNDAWGDFELGFGLRTSEFQFSQTIPTTNRSEKKQSEAWKIDATWEARDWLRGRASYQRSVRAPNFSELFATGLSSPQIFDPCNRSSAARQGPNGAQLAALCVATGIPAANIATYAAPPGGQAQITTSGNVNLNPEEGETLALGLVFSIPSDNKWAERFRAAVDYYNIKVTDAITPIDVNAAIAACYNYYGTNPSYTVAGNTFCQGLVRAGGTLLGINRVGTLPGVPANNFPGLNDGEFDTSGIDVSFTYGFDLEWLGLPDWGSVRVNGNITRLLEFNFDSGAGVPMQDYAGTVSFFGAGLGTSYPEWKTNLNVAYDVGDFTFDARVRYTSSMTNRLLTIFPGEVEFGGGPPNVPAVTYVDLGASWDVSPNIRLRVGVNNVADEQPPLYSPNVQSGTEPSLYDVVGRRAFGQIELKF